MSILSVNINLYIDGTQSNESRKIYLVKLLVYNEKGNSQHLMAEKKRWGSKGEREELAREVGKNPKENNVFEVKGMNYFGKVPIR